MSMVRLETVKIMFTQAPKDGQRVLAADLGNAYLHSYTKEKVIIELGEEWGEHGGQSVIVRKAIYGLVGSAHAFHQYVAKSMLKLGLRSAGETDVWLQRRGISGTEWPSTWTTLSSCPPTPRKWSPSCHPCSASSSQGQQSDTLGAMW